MRDLETALGRWRDEQASGTTLSVDAIEELEAHLRESAEHLIETGLSVDEALLVAEHRLGRPRALESEFRRASGPIADRRLRWLLAGVVLAVVVPFGVRVLGTATTLAAFAMGVPSEWVVYAAPVVALGMLSGLAIWVLRLPRGAGVVTRFVEGGAPGGRRWLTIGVCAAIAAGYASQVALSVGMARVVAAEAYGYFTIGTRLVSLTLTAVVPAAAIWALAKRQRPPAAS